MLMSNDPSKRIHGLYALTPDEADTAKLLRQVAAALDGGVRWLQYRNKRADAALRQRQARELQALCAIVGAQLIVRIKARAIFPNCPRYIPKLALALPSR